jgi:hypothetical protein
LKTKELPIFSQRLSLIADRVSDSTGKIEGLPRLSFENHIPLPVDSEKVPLAGAALSVRQQSAFGLGGNVMVDVSAITGAIAALKGANDIAQAMIGLRDAAAFQTKLIEFQAKIIEANNSAFAAQDERTAFLQKIAELEKEVASFKAWEAEKERYTLQDVGLGSLAYVVKESMRDTEPPHKICARCYQHQIKSILQPREHSMNKLLFCPECKTEIKIGNLSWGVA